MRRTITLDSGAEYPINISSRDNYLIIRVATNNVMFGSDNLNFKELSQSDVLVITKYQQQHVIFRNDNEETITVEFQFSDIPISIKERNMNIENAVTVDEILNPIDVDKILNPVAVEKINQSVKVSGIENTVTVGGEVSVSEVKKTVSVKDISSLNEYQRVQHGVINRGYGAGTSSSRGTTRIFDYVSGISKMYWVKNMFSSIVFRAPITNKTPVYVNGFGIILNPGEQFSVDGDVNSMYFTSSNKYYDAVLKQWVDVDVNAKLEYFYIWKMIPIKEYK